MNALTICQPYAELIICGEKRVENRTWTTGYKGPLLIHAGKSRQWLDSYKPLPAHMDYGVVIGVVQLRGCIRFRRRIPLHAVILEAWPWLDGHPHCMGPYCWILEDAFRFPHPVPFPGRQRLFDVPSGLVATGLSQAMEARAARAAMEG